MLRGLVYAAAMTIVRLIQGTLINAWQTQAGLISVVLLVLFVIGVVVWGLIDGRADARANPDPDRRDDLAMTWLLAGLLAGVLSGAVCWLIALVYKGLYTGGLLNEITTFAAFTALIIFLPGIIGVTVGRWRVDRNPDAHRPAGPGEERADTDVFSAVRGDDAPTGEIPTGAAAAQHEPQTSAVATAEREAPTETLPTHKPAEEARTETLPTSDDAKTEVIRTDATESRHAEPEKD
ncbi:hypothetical protein MSAS_01270 [Mycobacterium saskatchewanense]|uniref:Transmembrane protein n=2 Tax=Mycobacterium saskatchewanense TaxID=220927 RepID=A0AAJ3TTZ4_9MYCO|nr:hypothetical protein AWC23_01120 [Mycobacterium saskatchewanense]BBX60953.1 hypothetical protein MSAS_01270 [Mycobacterium saskatchewanense]